MALQEIVEQAVRPTVLINQDQTREEAVGLYYEDGKCMFCIPVACTPVKGDRTSLLRDLRRFVQSIITQTMYELGKGNVG